MIYSTVVVEPEIIKSIVDVDVMISDAMVDVDVDLTTDIKYSEMPAYDGAIDITPSSDVQILETKNTVLYENIVINPIPSNYGRISWNGISLTVS